MEQATAIKQLLDSFVKLPRPSAEELEVSKPFHDLALKITERAPDSQDTLTALHKLLEARDATIRATFPETVQDAARRGFKGE